MIVGIGSRALIQDTVLVYFLLLFVLFCFVLFYYSLHSLIYSLIYSVPQSSQFSSSYADKYPSIFLPQMEAIMFIILQIIHEHNACTAVAEAV